MSLQNYSDNINQNEKYLKNPQKSYASFILNLIFENDNQKHISKKKKNKVALTKQPFQNVINTDKQYFSKQVSSTKSSSTNAHFKESNNSKLFVNNQLFSKNLDLNAILGTSFDASFNRGKENWKNAKSNDKLDLLERLKPLSSSRNR